MTMTTPVSTPAAASGGVGGGNGVVVTGLGDLFSMLLGEGAGTGGNTGGGDAVSALLAQLSHMPGGAGLNGVQVQGQDILDKLLQGQAAADGGNGAAVGGKDDAADGSLVLEGAAGAVAVLVQQVEVLYQQVVVQGKFSLKTLDKPDELAKALTYLGMPADEAAGVAERISTMMKILEQQQKAVAGGSDTSGMMALMLAGVMMQQPGQAASPADAGQQGVSLEIQVTQRQATVKVIQLAQVFTRGKGMDAADVARQMAGVKAAGADDEVLAGTVDTPKDDEGKVAAQAVQKPVADDGAKAGQGVGKPAAVVIQVNNDGQGGVSIAVAPVKAAHEAKAAKDDGGVKIDAAKSEVAAAAMPASVTRVAPDKVLDKPTGTVAYSLRAGRNGTETLHAVKAAVEAPAADWQGDGKDGGASGLLAQTQGDGSFAAAMNAAAMNGSNGGLPPAADAARAFAAHMQAAQQANAAQQVMVQMQPLLHDGGGSVRMTLHPADLGSVRVDLHVSDGRVHGVIAASDPAVVEQLARELHGFRQGLADAGLKLGEQGINLMLSNDSNQGQPQQGRQGQRNASRSIGGVAAVGEGTADIAAATTAWVAPERMLDVNI